MPYGSPEVLVERVPFSNPDDMIDDVMRAVFSAWQQMADEAGGVPMWNMDFCLKVPSAMSRSTIMEVNGDGASYSLIGEVVREFMSLDKSKGPLDDLIPKSNADDIRYRLSTCVKHRAPHYCLKTMSWNQNRDYIKYEVLYLPFVEQGADTPTRFFITIAFHMDDIDAANPIGAFGPPERGSE